MQNYDFDVRLAYAFKEMRKRGLIARQNFRCCQSCACYEIATTMEKPTCKKIGYVFYHSQDNARKRKFQDFHLAFGGRHNNEGDTEATQNVGKLIVKCLADNGVKSNWNGDTATRILVLNQ